MDTTRLLKVRKHLKMRKPEFLRQDSHKKVALAPGWRKPKGKQSKMRLHLRGYRRSVSKGYKSPAAIRGLGHDGKKEVLVSSAKDLVSLQAQHDVCVFARGVGLKKRIVLTKLCQEKGIAIRQIKDPAVFLKTVEQDIQQRKQEKKQKIATKAKKKEETVKQAKKKEEKKEEDKTEEQTIEQLAQTAEEKKEQEKKELDEVLTKKDAL